MVMVEGMVHGIQARTGTESHSPPAEARETRI
jgi:hypothetical protein